MGRQVEGPCRINPEVAAVIPRPERLSLGAEERRVGLDLVEAEARDADGPVSGQDHAERQHALFGQCEIIGGGKFRAGKGRFKAHAREQGDRSRVGYVAEGTGREMRVRKRGVRREKRMLPGRVADEQGGSCTPCLMDQTHPEVRFLRPDDRREPPADVRHHRFRDGGDGVHGHPEPRDYGARATGLPALRHAGGDMLVGKALHRTSPLWQRRRPLYRKAVHLAACIQLAFPFLQNCHEFRLLAIDQEDRDAGLGEFALGQF